MKIAVLGTRGFPGVQGGVEAHCQNLYPRLVKLGCDVTVFGRAPYLHGESVYEGVNIIPLSCPKSKFLEAFIHTFKGILAARKIKPDIIHIHAVGPALAIPIARIMGFKVVMTNHGPDYKRKKWNQAAKLILRMGEYLGSHFANIVICISQTIADDIRRRYRRGIYVIPNGVDMPSMSEGTQYLNKYNLQKGKYILAVGRFVPEKGFHDLLEAFEIASSAPSALPRNDKIKLVIVGDADHEDKYSLSLKERAWANPNIVLTGFISGEPLREIYSHVGLFVLPSYYEGLPIVLLEAMSYGLSCIVSDIPANREVKLQNERYFKPGDIEQLRLKIVEYINNPLSPSEKESQLTQISQKYDWDKIARETLAAYRSA